MLVGGLETHACPASGITAPRIVGDVVEQAWQPLVTTADGAVRHFDFRTAGAVLTELSGLEAWRLELRGPTQKVRHDRLFVEVAGQLDDRDREVLAERLDVAAGAAPHDVKVVADPMVVEDAIEQLGSPFLDRR